LICAPVGDLPYRGAISGKITGMLHPGLPLAPLLHGASGYWDEVLNLIPLLVGAILLIYFYFSSRRQKKDRERKE
jgi:hypothetical protein